MSEHSKKLSVLLHGLPGSERQRISRALPYPRSLRPPFIHEGRLGTSSDLYERRARKPCNSEGEGNQLRVHALLASKLGHSPGIGFVYIDARQGYAFTLVKAFKS